MKRGTKKKYNNNYYYYCVAASLSSSCVHVARMESVNTRLDVYFEQRWWGKKTKKWLWNETNGCARGKDGTKGVGGRVRRPQQNKSYEIITIIIRVSVLKRMLFFFFFFRQVIEKRFLHKNTFCLISMQTNILITISHVCFSSS